MKKTWIVLSLICVLAFGLRFYKVTEDPPSLNWDEVSIAYNAYSILKTGHDEWNQFLPIHFKAFGEYKLPAQIYASIPAIAIFGLNELGVRMTPVIYGTLTVLVTFFLAKELFNKKSAGLIAAFLLAISPWHLQLTRGSFEASFACLWISLGLWFFVRGFKSAKWFYYSMVPFAISVFTYNSARVFTPIFLVALVLVSWRYFLAQRKVLVWMIIIFLGLMLPLLPFVFNGDARARYKLVSITDDPGLIPRINERRGLSKLPQPLPRLVHNKVTYVSVYVAQHYLAHFTPQFLFLSGAPHKQHHVQGMGELYLFEAPFLFLGLFFIFRRKEKYRWFLIAWILLAFIPVSVTNDSIPHALRTVIVLPAYQIISGYGAMILYQFLVRKKTLGLVSLAAYSLFILASLGYYFYQYYAIYPVLYSRDWQYGYSQVVSYIQAHQAQYDQIVFSRHYGEPQIFTLFFMQYDPYKFQHDSNLVRFETHDWVRVLHFDKYYFPDLGDMGTRYQDIVKAQPRQKLLFIGKPGDFSSNVPALLTVNFLNGEPDFVIVEKQ